MNGSTTPATAIAPQREGLRQRGLVLGALSVKLIEQALPLLGATSEEGQAFAKAAAMLGKVVGKVSPDLEQAEMRLLQQQTPAVGQPTPDQGAAFKNMIQSRLSRLGPPPGSPPGAAGTPPAAGASTPPAPGAAAAA